MKSSASLVEAVSVAFGSLRSSKLRSFLTLLGIILATTTLIAVMSVIEGMNRYIAEKITTDLGAGSFRIDRIVRVGSRDMKKWIEMIRRNPELSREEFEFLKAHVTQVRELGLEDARGAPLQHGADRMERVQVRGASISIALI